MAFALDIASWVLLCAGGAFCVVGALGMLRMPDFYTRVHAASVIDTLGAGLILAGLILQAGLTLVSVKLVFLALLLFITSFTWNIFHPPFMRMTSIFDKIEYFNNINQFLNNNPLFLRINLLSVLLILIFYFVTVKIFLNIKIKKVHVFLSGLVFCLLWIIAREIFQWYVEHISKVNLVYGSLSSIIIILLWIYYSSAALLYSIEFLHLLHTKKKWT